MNLSREELLASSYQKTVSAYAESTRKLGPKLKKNLFFSYFFHICIYGFDPGPKIPKYLMLIYLGGKVVIKEKGVIRPLPVLNLISVQMFYDDLSFGFLLFNFSQALSLPSKLCVSSTMVPQPRIPVLRNICFATQPEDRKGCNFCQTGSFRPFSYVYMYNIRTQPTKNFLPPPHMRENLEGGREGGTLSQMPESSAGICKQSMGARNRVGYGYRTGPTRLLRLTELIHWNRFLGSLKV
jgi:hypothetical protein